MDAYVIVGQRKSGKSSVARSITGCRVGGVRPILTITGKVIDVYVRLSSLQESRVTLAEFVREVSQQKCDAVLFSLWPSAGYKYPDADAYLQYFMQRGWPIKYVTCLGVPVSAITTVLHKGTLATFQSMPPAPVNQLAAQVRGHYRWV